MARTPVSPPDLDGHDGHDFTRAGSDAELAVVVVSPGVHRAVGGERQGVPVTSRDRDDRAQRRNRRGDVGVAEEAVAELAVRYLSEDEAARLEPACEECLRPVVVVARNTGMRQGEIVSLTWPQVDFKTGFIRLTEAKKGEGRDVPMNETAEAQLKELQQVAPGQRVFYGLDGKPVKQGWVYRAFRRACRDAEVEDFHFHDLRHDCASRLVMAGVDLQTVKEILGHKTLAMTMRYAHLSPDHKLRAIRVLHQKVGTPLDTCDDSAGSEEEGAQSQIPGHIWSPAAE